jgi:hypothetical protein
MTQTFKLERLDGTPAEPPTLKTTVLAWSPATRSRWGHFGVAAMPKPHGWAKRDVRQGEKWVPVLSRNLASDGNAAPHRPLRLSPVSRRPGE